MRKKPQGWQRYAEAVDIAREAARRQMLGLTFGAGVVQALPGGVLEILKRLKPSRPSRHRPSFMDSPRPRKRLGQVAGPGQAGPRHVWGFHEVVCAIAAAAGCSVPTLYRWEQEWRALQGKPRRLPRSSGRLQGGDHQPDDAR
jgi:hypothetical protein